MKHPTDPAPTRPAPPEPGCGDDFLKGEIEVSPGEPGAWRGVADNPLCRAVEAELGARAVVKGIDWEPGPAIWLSISADASTEVLVRLDDAGACRRLLEVAVGLAPRSAAPVRVRLGEIARRLFRRGAA